MSLFSGSSWPAGASAGTGTVAAGGVGGAAAALTAIGDFGTVDAAGTLATGGDGGATGESGI